MKRALKTLVALALAAGLVFWFFSRPKPLAPSDLPQHQGDPANGELVFHAAGCAACHGDNLAGGLELKTAFGTFRVPNITPDTQDGIGAWSLLDFVNAVQRGLSPSGQHFYPAFPYSSYVRMTPADVIDLKAYLDTFEPVAGRVPDSTLRFPFSIRRGIGLWKRLYLDPSPVIDVPESDRVLQRGRYLVEALGHCGACHTPRNFLAGPDFSRWLGGAPSLEGDGRVPNITPSRDGLESWSTADIAYYLKSGFTPDFDTVGGAMVDVQENLARLPDADREAIAAYLKAVPPVSDPAD